MAAPPLSAGADHVTVAESCPGVAVTPVGAPGGASGVPGVAERGSDGGPHPALLLAVTRTVYVRPSVRPVMVADVADGPAVTVTSQELVCPVTGISPDMPPQPRMPLTPPEAVIW
jgi:hypothetical protein